MNTVSGEKIESKTKKQAIVVLFLLGLPFAAMADSIIGKPPAMNCAPLMPKTQPTEEIRAATGLQLEAITAKLFSGKFDGEVRYKKKDLLVDVPNADKVMLAQLSAYLLCEQTKSRADHDRLAGTVFVNQVLPVLVPNLNTQKIIEIRPLPIGGSIEIADQETKLFDGGRIAITVAIATSQKPEAKVYIEQVLPDGTSKFYDNPQSKGIPLGGTRNYSLGSKRFSLTFKEYFDGNEKAVFLVKRI